MPLLDGALVFGDAVKCVHEDVPRRAQRNDYPGLIGTEELDQGPAVPRTVITGRVFGSTPGEVGNWLTGLMSFNDGLVHVLVDSEGVTWPAAKFESLRYGELARNAGSYGYTRNFVLTMYHLTYPSFQSRDWLRP